MKRHFSRAWRPALVLLALPALAATMGPTLVPGTLNYIEGWVVLDGHQLPAKSVNTTVLEVNQMLDTKQGKAELLLIPGAFLRIGDQSRIRMVSSGLADTRVELLRGSAILEVDEIYKETNLFMEVDGATARIEKKGLYAFNADRPAVRVLDGKATVYQGDTPVTLKKGREVLLASAQPLKAQKANKDARESDALYRWSKIRSEYAARANINAARRVALYGGWYGAGWYWDPYWNIYSFVPATGILYGPFGWGLYSPGFGFGHPRGFAHGPGLGHAGSFGHGGGLGHNGFGHGHMGGHGH